MEHENDNSSASVRVRAGKYLSFNLGDEAYGIEILKVHEIIRMTDITRLPRTPKYMKGVINLRGKITPVVDMRSKFGLPEKEGNERTCIIVVELHATDAGSRIGLIVDEVSEVLAISADQIELSPSFGTNCSPEFIPGMGKIGDDVVMLLDIDRVLSSGEINEISMISNAVDKDDHIVEHEIC